MSAGRALAVATAPAKDGMKFRLAYGQTADGGGTTFF